MKITILNKEYAEDLSLDAETSEVRVPKERNVDSSQQDLATYVNIQKESNKN